MSDLCSQCSTTRWYPTPIRKIDTYLNKFICSGNNLKYTYALRKNISYNLQYLEYLDLSIKQIRLSSVLEKQSYKSFIISGIGIIESISYYIIRKNGFHKENYWKLIKSTQSNEFKLNKDKVKIENNLYLKLNHPIEEELSFDSMIKKLESKKLLGSNHEIYKKLGYLRKLRNRVHLHIIEQAMDTDWNNFKLSDFELMKKVLYAFLTCSFFSPTTEEKNMFSHLKV